jgi:fibronectin-binding autotransporter adhesin
MKQSKILKSAFAFVPLLLVSGAFAAEYQWNGTTNSLATPTGWTPTGASITSGSTVTPLAGDILNLTAGDINVGGTLVIGAGAEAKQTAAGQHRWGSLMQLAGTGTDGLGAFKNQGNDWANVSNVALTANATVNLTGAGWRHDDHGSGTNQLALNGNALTFTGNQGVWFVNTTIVGPGTINGTTGAGVDFNFEGSAILPANVTMNLSNNTKSSSWDGAGRVMLGNINIIDNGGIETRQNDAGKTFAGTITIGTTAAHTLNVSVLTENGTTDNHMIVSGQITGPGGVKRTGVAGQDATFTNPANNYAGGTSVEGGRLTKGAAGAIPAGMINVSGGELALNGFNQSMTSGLIKGGVISGAGSTLTMDGPGVKEIKAGASITTSGGAQLSGGTLKVDYNTGNNIINTAVVNNSLLVSGNATLQPYQDAAILPSAGLLKWNKNGDAGNHVGDFNAIAGDPSATAGATFRGIDTGINSINVFANEGSKEFGNNNRFIYTGQIVNTTASDIVVSFAENYDDEVRVKIDGNTGVLQSTNWNDATQSAAVTITPGAHTVEFMSYDGGGGQGPHDGFEGKGIGIALGVPALAGANYSAITLATMPAGLTLTTGATIDNRADRTENKLIEIDTGATLTVDTTLMQGKKYTLSGDISGEGGISKTGTGVLALSSANFYTGPTKVIQGTLRLENAGALGDSPTVDIASGAFIDSTALAGGLNLSGKTLTGVGTHQGMLVMGTGAISPGNSLGTLTISGDLTASASSVFNMELGISGASDKVIINGTTGTFTEGGATLNLTSLTGALSYVPGNSWDLFDATTSVGGFGTLNLPALSSDYTWNTSLLNSTGVISIVPEASSSLLMALGASFLFRRRRSA